MNYPQTRQEIFEAVWRYFVIEGHPRSYTNKAKASCAYRGVDGAKCAVGLFIPDESYRPSMDTGEDDTGVGPLYDAGVFSHDPELEEFIGKNLTLLGELQGAHDRPDAPIDYSLKQVAQRFGLEVPYADR